MAIKRAIGRLEFLLRSFEEKMAIAGCDHLPITAAHGMLIAQALAEGLTLVSEDGAFAPSGVPLLPAA